MIGKTISHYKMLERLDGEGYTLAIGCVFWLPHAGKTPWGVVCVPDVGTLPLEQSSIKGYCQKYNIYKKGHFQLSGPSTYIRFLLHSSAVFVYYGVDIDSDYSDDLFYIIYAKNRLICESI